MSANQKPRAYSYIRFSNATQAAGDSYRRQREAAEAYCTQHGLELVDAKEYSFFDQGRSAYKARHLDDTGELARFLAFVQDGTIPKGSTLLVESLDRLSRERVKDALPRFLDLLNQGINVVTLADGRLYTSAYNELDLIISIVQMSRAHEESATKGKRVSAAWRRKQDSARTDSLPIGKLCPLWLDYTPDGYIPNPERVEVVQRIYKLAQDGYGHRAIAAQLNQSGVPSFSADRKNASGLWANSGIARTLSNRAVLGEYQPHQFIDGKRVPVGAPITGFYPPIITEDEFTQLNRLSRLAVSRRLLNPVNGSMSGKVYRSAASAKVRCTSANGGTPASCGASETSKVYAQRSRSCCRVAKRCSGKYWRRLIASRWYRAIKGSCNVRSQYVMAGSRRRKSGLNRCNLRF